MNIKTLIFLIALIPGSTALQGKTVTNTIDFGSSVFAVGKDGLGIAEGIITAGYRRVASPGDIGFYYGTDFTLGVPVIQEYFDHHKVLNNAPGNDLFMSFKVPFGYRWSGKDNSMGFYLGGGPALQMVSEWDTRTIYGIGAFGELGWQTNKTAGIGFHFGLQLSISPLIYSPDQGTFSNIIGTDVSIRFGMSWRRKKS
ncbi:MAG: hypothetical protein KAH21_13370 [Spirochaetaceae bacterium]|nr:hypothetical protein [Spirochaetaceae bacterium]